MNTFGTAFIRLPFLRFANRLNPFSIGFTIQRIAGGIVTGNVTNVVWVALTAV